jgi:cell division protein ZapA
MNDKKHSVRVTILNEEYSIRTSATPEHTKAVARHLDQAIGQVLATGAVVENPRAVVLAALQITAELFEARASAAELAARAKTLSDDVRRWLPPGKR